jgi:cytochrome c biogenesis protein CcdA/thiol-disulfide isomerase/thioredoxin
MLLLLLFAFISGCLTIIAPCIWPLLPIVLSAGATRQKSKAWGITLGVMLSFGLLTLFLAYIVKTIPFNTNILRYIAALIIAFFGLTLIIPALNTFVEGNISLFTSRFASKKNQKSSGFLSGFIIGLSLGIVWSPCAGPILATIATLAATREVNVDIVWVTLFYVLGNGVPLFLLANAGAKIIEGSKAINKFLRPIQVVFGTVIIIVAIAIATNYVTYLESQLLTFVPSYSDLINNIEGNSAISGQLQEIKSVKSSGSLPIMSKAPDFVGITHWLNTTKPLHISDLKGKVVLVDFWTYTCINCIRTLPHVTAWYNTYKKDGFVVIGVHTPEFQFEHDTSNVEQAMQQYGINYPVAQDNNYATWNNYNNEYWPAEYLIDQNGYIRKTDFGEGGYSDMEQAIRELLQSNGVKMVQKQTNVSDQTPTQSITPETYLGFNRGADIVQDETIAPGLQSFTSTTTPGINEFRYNGEIDVEGDYIIPQSGSSLQLNFYATNVYLVISPIKPTPTSIQVEIDGNQISNSIAGSDVNNGYITLNTSHLYRLVNLHGNYQQHTLQLNFSDNGNQVYVFTFG